MSISFIMYPIGLLIGYFLWKKSGEKNYYWSLYPVAILFFVSILQFVSETQLGLTQSARELEFYIYTFIRVVTVIVFLIILFRK